MGFAKKLSLLLLVFSALGAQDMPQDPVMKARSLRAQAQGISVTDLPPVPRSITEPPPLPPPETHLKDTRGGRLAATHPKSQRASKRAKRAGRSDRADRADRTERPEPKAAGTTRTAKNARVASAPKVAKHAGKGVKVQRKGRKKGKA